ncbi:MAG: hypothetical protein R3F20_07985 [Planctomycetota bacterium]
MIVGGRLAVDERIDDLVGGRIVRIAMSGPAEGVAKRLSAVDGVGAVHRVENADGAAFDLELDEPREITGELYALAVAEGWPLTELAVQRRSLEDVFREVSRVEGGAA